MIRPFRLALVIAISVSLGACSWQLRAEKLEATGTLRGPGAPSTTVITTEEI